MPRKIQKIANPYAIKIPCNHSKCDSSNKPFETCIPNNQINLSYQPVVVISKKKVYYHLDPKIGSVNKIVLPYNFSKCNSIHVYTLDNFLNSKLICQKSINSLPSPISSIKLFLN
ncbi:hypothetical protein ACTFIW_005369 [Dictyostelium discoideum]